MRFSLALSFSAIISRSFAISDTSPVMDMLNHHSGRSSPAQVNSESKSPTMEGRPSSRGRGGQGGFYRGGRGRGVMGGGAPQGSRGGRGGRGGFQPGRPTTVKKDTLKFEGEYDFDKANEEFKEVLEKLQVLLVSDHLYFQSSS